MPEYNVSSNEDLETALAITEPGDVILGSEAPPTDDAEPSGADADKTT
ncbi:hypothetical protein [Nocardia seriolae]|uniref:Uncharacterized protein n=1 Tax=Nocardia seriolae TaxID=37332 RepID=A0ABC8AUB9_9NOCA|nr:hypothetical protein [Nocardia seriolae]APA97582.1 hypothetical protein NS506_03530 [Nocardia seriolae]MTJ62472.1 hypothetical protein [Nocardia seriolae]MTJ76510.1 hypothetical protein [Nocardia seriolae]MTJ87374.1 hypothetical protein [Nocardia seriolae]MTK31366.1 hypothetical protein [Nocardia seriolae]